MKRYQIFVNGKFINSNSDQVIKVTNPATENIISEVPSCNIEDVQKAVDSAVVAQKKWKNISPVERAVYLNKIADKMREYARSIGKIISEEQGKTLLQGEGEIIDAAGLMDYHAEWARRIDGEVISSDSKDENIIVYKEPLGVVACILPWNFPIYVLVRKMAPALITGNTVILKPSSETPNSALEVAKIFEEVGVPEGVINVITGKGSVVGNALASNPKVNFVTITGSTEAGQKIMKACADNVTKVSLELGGKAPAIVMNDADLDLAVNCIINSRVSNAGQVCNCAERVYVQEKVAEEFISKVIEGMKKVTYGNGIEKPDSIMGSLINKEAVTTVHDMVEKAIQQGAVLRLGGNIPNGKGAFYEPTILSDCNHSMDIMHKEIFGPVLPIMVFKTLDEVIGLANDCEYGLTSTLYTNDLNTALKISNNIESGELYINRKQGEAYQGFHAGWKKSGIGGDDGKHGMEEFLRTRVVYIKY